MNDSFNPQFTELTPINLNFTSQLESDVNCDVAVNQPNGCN